MAPKIYFSYEEDAYLTNNWTLNNLNLDSGYSDISKLLKSLLNEGIIKLVHI